MPRVQTNYGDTPYAWTGAEQQYVEFMHSQMDKAMTVNVTLAAGYGKLIGGTVLAKNLTSAAGNKGKYIPYNPTTFNSASYVHPGRLWLVANGVNGESTVNVSVNDSYKIVVGDDIFAMEHGGSVRALSLVTAITRYTTYATVTFTSTLNTTFETSTYSYIAVTAGDSSNNYSDAVGILAYTVDTGEGEYAKGAQGVMIVGNALMYTNCLNLIDAAAKTDLGSSDIGDLTYMK